MDPELARLRTRVILFLVLLAVTAAAFVLALTLVDDPVARTFIAVGTGLATVAFTDQSRC